MNNERQMTKGSVFFLGKVYGSLTHSKLLKVFFFFPEIRKKKTSVFFSQEKFTGPLTPLFKELSIPFFSPLIQFCFFSREEKKINELFDFSGVFFTPSSLYGHFLYFFRKKIKFI